MDNILKIFTEVKGSVGIVIVSFIQDDLMPIDTDVFGFPKTKKIIVANLDN